MADHFARIFGTEEDKVNCPFYYKIGACRHGDRCSRNHMRPHFSQTVLVPHFYAGLPPQPNGQPQDDSDHFEDFFEEISDELMKYGELEQLQVVENLGEHMIGNVYVKYRREEEAEACMKAIMGRFYGGRMLTCEYSPVTDFNEARCRQFDEGTCNRGGYCNFMHLRRIPQHLKKELRRKAKERYKTIRTDRSDGKDGKEGSGSTSAPAAASATSSSSGGGKDDRRSRSRSRERRRDRRSRSRSRERRDDRRRDRSRSRERRDDRSSSRRGGDDRGGSSSAAASSSSSGSDRRDDRGRDRRDDRGRDDRAASGSSSSGGAGGRSESEERRAKIAMWNKEKDDAAPKS